MAKRGRYSPDDLVRSEDLKFTPGEVISLPARLDDPGQQEQWLADLRNPAVPKILDLFCGAGGMSKGFVDAGFAVIAGLDHARAAVQTYAANIAVRAICTDIDGIEEPESLLDGMDVSGVDVIVGGPPCQGFSVVGRARIRSLAEEEQDRLLARNELYQHFFRFVEIFQPALFVMENVPTLLTFENEAYIKAIEKECERLGYELDRQVIDAVDYGVPQVRRRLFIVGSRIGRLFRWPRQLDEQDQVTLIDAIGDLPAVKPPSLVERMPYRPQGSLSLYQQLMRSNVPEEDRNVIYDHIVRPVRQDDIEIFTNMKPGHRYVDIDPQYRRYNSASFTDKYYMLKPDAPGVTITAHMAKDGYRYIHWDTAQHRTLSIREAARIQSFSDEFRFAGSRTARFQQIGNAVPPLMAERLAEQVRRALDRRNSGLLPGDTLQLGLPGLEHRTHVVAASE